MRKRFFTVTVITLATAVGVLLSSPTVGARPAVSDSPASASNAKADIQEGNLGCGFGTGKPVIGFVNFHRLGNRVSINFHLKDGSPNTNYVVSLWGQGCSFAAFLGSTTTNQNGVANFTGSTTVPPALTRFFATGWGGPLFFNDTTTVTLEP